MLGPSEARKRLPEPVRDASENATIALLLIERLQNTSGDRLTAAEFLRDIGMEEFVSHLPGGSRNQRG